MGEPISSKENRLAWKETIDRLRRENAEGRADYLRVLHRINDLSDRHDRLRDAARKAKGILEGYVREEPDESGTTMEEEAYYILREALAASEEHGEEKDGG